ncbi:MAG: formylglycine-generating enzyme family protein, partial [Chloroflexi bacterium]|nr:formylglycine-generating enzyme family protein [Chloroflexota bacterium]
YPYVSSAKRENLRAGPDVLRVLRGGAFVSAAGRVRCAFRDWFNPNLHYRYLGFRVVASPINL